MAERFDALVIGAGAGGLAAAARLQASGYRTLLVERVCAGEDWPAQRAVAGHDLPTTTPIANPWNVGDGVRTWTGAGQSGCVESARLVVEQIRRHPRLRP